jgi:hypothetical protein
MVPVARVSFCGRSNDRRCQVGTPAHPLVRMDTRGFSAMI